MSSHLTRQNIYKPFILLGVMKTIQVEIEGVTPLLMNKYNVEAEIQRQKGKRITKIYDSEEEAEKSAYWGTGKKKELIVPSEVLYASILNASSL